MHQNILTFKNVRVRLCRLEFDTWHSGWVSDLSPEMARVKTQGFQVFEKDERILCECYGDGALVRFQGTIIGQAGQEIAIGITGSLIFQHSQETVRIQSENISGTLSTQGAKASIVVLDVSPSSLGGLVDQAFAPATVLDLRLEVLGGEFDARVSLVNCRSEPSQPGYFRVGLNIVDASRLSAALWKRIVKEQSER